MPNAHANATGLNLHEDKRIKQPVKAASTANITLTAPGATIDGVTMVAGDRFLGKNQTLPAENGPYTWNGAAVAATRTPDATTAADFVQGFKVFVLEGTANTKTYWTFTQIAAITLGTTALTFAQDAGSGTVTSVALTVPNEFSIAGSPVTGSGTLAITKAVEGVNQVWAGPPSGGSTTPAFRLLVDADIPALPESRITNLTTDLSTKAPNASPTFTGSITTPAVAVSGLSGSVAASRYVGATATGAPSTGAHLIGDFVIDQTGKIWVCTVNGTPGTFDQVGSGGTATVSVEELDGAPSVSASVIKFPNGTLTDNGSGSVTYTPSGGVGTTVGATLFTAQSCI